MRILSSSPKWEVEEERRTGWGEFLWEDWFLGEGDEEFGDDGFSFGGVSVNVNVNVNVFFYTATKSFMYFYILLKIQKTTIGTDLWISYSI